MSGKYSAFVKWLRCACHFLTTDIGQLSRSHTRVDYVDLEDIKRFLCYAGEQGIGEANGALSTLVRLLAEYEVCIQRDEQVPKRRLAEMKAELFVAYSRLCHLTPGISGRTLKHSAQIGRRTFWPIVTTYCFLFTVLCLEFLSASNDSIKQGAQAVAPFFWGGLGAGIFILKRLSDVSSDLQFNDIYLKGWFIRIGLGGILGWVVSRVFMISTSGDGSGTEAKTETHIPANTLALFTGISIKLVYGALEGAIESAVRRFDLKPSTTTSAPASRGSLAPALADIDPIRNPAAYQAVTAALDQEEKGRRS